MTRVARRATAEPAAGDLQRRIEDVRNPEHFAPLLPGINDEDHYKALVPRYRTTSAAIEAADAEVADLEQRIASLADRRHDAIATGDTAALMDVMALEQNGPLQLHMARIRAASFRAEHFAAEAARIRREAAEALSVPSHWIIELQARVLDEAALIRSACSAADAGARWCADEASSADAEVRRLRSIDPTKTPLVVHGVPKVEPVPPGDTPMSSVWQISTNGHDVVGINGRALVQADADGNDVRRDGFRVRVDGVLIDDEDRPVKDAGGRLRRVLSGLVR